MLRFECDRAGDRRGGFFAVASFLALVVAELVEKLGRARRSVRGCVWGFDGASATVWGRQKRISGAGGDPEAEAAEVVFAVLGSCWFIWMRWLVPPSLLTGSWLKMAS